MFAAELRRNPVAALSVLHERDCKNVAKNLIAATSHLRRLEVVFVLMLCGPVLHTMII